jgi:hypothetical protein
MGRMGGVKSPEVEGALLHPDAPDDTRCTKNDYRRWRCARTKVEGSRFCSHHGKQPDGIAKVHAVKELLGGTDGDANGNGAPPDKDGSGSGNGDSLKKLDGGPDANANVAILDAGVSGSGSGDALKKVLGGGAGADANANGAVPDAGGSGSGSGGGGGTGEMRVACPDGVASPGDDKTALRPATLPSSTGHAAPELGLRELKQMLQLKLAESTARVDEVNISYIICFSVLFVCLFVWPASPS